MLKEGGVIKCGFNQQLPPNHANAAAKSERRLIGHVRLFQAAAISNEMKKLKALYRLKMTIIGHSNGQTSFNIDN
jgi:hypothetical protein